MFDFSMSTNTLWTNCHLARYYSQFSIGQSLILISFITSRAKYLVNGSILVEVFSKIGKLMNSKIYRMCDQYLFVIKLSSLI